MPRPWDQRSDVVTPEAVALQFQEANVGSRTVAILVDFTILGLALWLVNISVGFLIERTTTAIPGWVAVTVLVLVNFTAVFGYPLAFETLAHGKTPGKAVMGLRVVTVEGSPVRFRHAAIRAAFWLVDFGLTMGIAAVFATLLSKRHQRLGDLVAGTVVLRERSAATPPRAATFDVPESARAYAATIDASQLAVRDYEALREFLLRAPDLDAGKRDEIAGRLAAAFAGRIGHQIPSKVPPMLFLQCLAARFQQRATAAASAESRVAPAREDTPAPPSHEEWGDFAPPR